MITLKFLNTYKEYCIHHKLLLHLNLYNITSKWCIVPIKDLKMVTEISSLNHYLKNRKSLYYLTSIKIYTGIGEHTFIIIITQITITAYQYIIRHNIWPILFSTSTSFLLVPLLIMVSSICEHRLPRGSRASRTSRITSAASTTWVTHQNI